MGLARCFVLREMATLDTLAPDAPSLSSQPRGAGALPLGTKEDRPGYPVRSNNGLGSFP